MAGAGLGFGAGLSRGFANALVAKRQRDRQTADKEAERRDRLFGQMLPFMVENAEDYSDIEAAITAQYPELAGGGPRGKSKGDTPLSKIGKFLAPFVGLKRQAQQAQQPQSPWPQPVYGNDLPSQGGILGRMPIPQAPTLQQTPGPPSLIPPSHQPPGVTGGTLDSIMQTAQPVATDISDAEADRIVRGGGPMSAQAPQTARSAQAQQPAAAPSNTLFGVRLMTPEQKAARTMRTDEAQITARHALALRLGLKPEQANAFALTGKYPTPEQLSDEFTLSPGQARFRGEKKVAEVPASAAAGNQINTFDEALLAAQAKGDQAEVTRLLDLQRRQAEAKREPKAAGADDETTAFAAMVADNPAMLQGVTPTVASDVMKTLAKNPALRARYEQVRMEPIRQQAGEVLKTLDQLLDVQKTMDKDGNITAEKVRGLSGGAKMLYGKSNLLGAQFIPGSDSAGAKAALEQITGQLALDLIAQMKAQSRTGATGFGQLNAKELALLEASASILKGNISEELAFEKLKDLRERYQRILKPSAQESIATKLGASAASGAPAAAPSKITLDTPIFIGPGGQPSLTPAAAGAR